LTSVIVRCTLLYSCNFTLSIYSFYRYLGQFVFHCACAKLTKSTTLPSVRPPHRVTGFLPPSSASPTQMSVAIDRALLYYTAATRRTAT